MTDPANPAVPEFRWYAAGRWTTLEQGDLLPDCPVLVPPGELSTALLDVKPGAEIGTPLRIEFANLVLLSQSCDLLKPSITQVLLCAHFPSEDYGKADRDAIRKERRPALHMIEQCDLTGHAFGQRVVEFRTIYTLPKDFILEFSGRLEERVRLLPPYREHLAQAFARYFMRVGLPRNIRDL